MSSLLGLLTNCGGRYVFLDSLELFTHLNEELSTITHMQTTSSVICTSCVNVQRILCVLLRTSEDDEREEWRLCSARVALSIHIETRTEARVIKKKPAEDEVYFKKRQDGKYKLVDDEVSVIRMDEEEVRIFNLFESEDVDRESYMEVTPHNDGRYITDEVIVPEST